MQNKYTRRIKAFSLSTALCCLCLPGNAQTLSSSDVQLELAANYNRNKQNYMNRSVNDVLTDLRNKFGIQFSFKADVAQNRQLSVPTSLEGENDVDTLLMRVLPPAGLSYRKANNVYIIQKAASTPAANGESFAPVRKEVERQRVQGDVTVTGTVTDPSGVGLPGVTVVVKGTTRGTATGVDGSFSLAVPSTGATLVFSYIGYTTQEVPVGNQSTLNVTLTEDAKALEEVVIIGYGTQRKSDLTGTVTAISEEEFQKGNIQTPEQLIAGKVAGVQITSNSGAPGAGSQIRIRGGSSLSASNDPLIVIDGVPVDNQGIAGTANPLALINPNDIESFNILRDASATAIYGSRASNGVIIITTKKGKAGEKMRVNFSSLASLSYNPNTLEVLTGDEYRAVVNQYAAPGNRNLLGDANTNWQELIYRNAWSFDNNLSVSGSIKSVPYRVSVGFLDQDGVLLTSNLERASAALSLNPTFLDDHLKVNLNVRGIKAAQRFADEGAVGTAVYFDPTQPVYADNNQFGGYFEWVDASGVINTLAPRNPLSTLEQTRNTSDVKRSIGNLQLDYKLPFLPALRANLNLGYDVSEGEGDIILPATLGSVFTQQGSISHYEQTKSNQLLDFYLNYTQEYAAIKSRVDLTGGYSYQKFHYENPTFPTLNTVGDVITQAGIPGDDTNVLISYFGRLNYTFREKYLLTATLRRDGSSRFSPEQRWGTFPALALAWRIADEPFMKGIEAISDLKLRLGYGLTGQQDIGSFYPYLPRYAYSNNEASYQFGDQFYSTLRPAGYDTDIKWEETATYNVGLDFGVLNNKLSGSIDYYFKRTEDLLSIIPVPAGANLTNRLFTNVGSLENKGVEAILSYAAISTNDLTWDLGFNATYNQNEITKLNNREDPSFVGLPVGGIGGGVGNTIQINSVGYPRNTFYVYQQVYNENGSPIERLYVDRNADGSFTDQDFYRYQSPDPDVFLGFTSQLSYKNWNFGFVFRGSIGNYVYNNINANAFYNNVDWPGYLLTIPRSILETNFVGEESERLFSDYFIENASFLRLDNFNVGYNFGRIFNEKANLRVAATGQNLFVITKYSGLDPEVTSGIDNSFYPRPRVFSLGVNIDL